MNSGYVEAQDLGTWMGRFKKQQGIEPQLMFWQYLNDNTGEIAKKVLDTASVNWKNYQMINREAMNNFQAMNF